MGVLLAASACAAHVFVPPAGPGAPAPEAAAAWDEATRSCRDVKNGNPNLRVALRRGRFRSGSLTVSVIVTSAGSIRLEDSTAFNLAGTAASAQLLLRQDRSLVTAPAADIVDALIGVKLGPERLLAMLSGCVTVSPSQARLNDAARFGKQIRIPVSDGAVFLEQRDGRWRAVAGEADALRIQYRAFEGYWPRAFQVASTASGADPVILDVGIEDFTVNDPNVDRSPDVFTLKVPADATPMTLEQLRAWARGGR